MKIANEVMQYSIPRYLQEEDEKEIPTSSYEIVELEEGKEIKIGKQLLAEEKKTLKKLLKNNIDVFAWKLDQIPGIERNLVEHKLYTKPTTFQ